MYQTKYQTQEEIIEFTKKFFKFTIEKMMANSKMHEDTTITPDNIYQPAHKANRDALFQIISESHLPGSTVIGEENIIKLYDLACRGKSCIIFSEHLSNLDVPSMFVRFYQQPNKKLQEIFEKIIFVAGVKLNETPIVKLFTEMFSRIVLYPLTNLSKLQGKPEFEEELRIARKVNIKSTRKMRELRNKGSIFLMYPAGTRYRPWKPETKKGIKETTSYLKSFDYFCCTSINGNNMPPMEHEDMVKEPFVKDIVTFNFGEVKDTKGYIKDICDSEGLDSINDREKIKQVVVDNIMNEIETLHKQADKYINSL